MMSIFKVNWREFFRELYKKAMDTDVLTRAASVAFYFSFAFFPLLLALVSIAGLVLESTEGLRQELFIYLGQLMPASAYELVQKTMLEIIENSSGGKITLGILVTLWSASAGVDSIRTALNSVYELEETRSWWHTKLQSLVLTFLFILLLGIVLLGVTYGLQLLQWLVSYAALEIPSWALSVIQWVVLAAVMILATAVIYSWIPNFPEFKWVWISPGAVAAILLWILFSSGFKLYLGYFNSYNAAYGSLGAVIILMLWMYLTALSLLIGGGINSVLTELSTGSEGASNRPREEEASPA